MTLNEELSAQSPCAGSASCQSVYLCLLGDYGQAAHVLATGICLWVSHLVRVPAQWQLQDWPPSQSGPVSQLAPAHMHQLSVWFTASCMTLSAHAGWLHRLQTKVISVSGHD